MTVRARLSIRNVGLAAATSKAEDEFAKVFGSGDFTITSTDLESDVVDVTGEVLSWRFVFVAERNGSSESQPEFA